MLALRPGSRIKNPDTEAYNDQAPPMGFVWWALIVSSAASFFWGNSCAALLTSSIQIRY